MLMPLPPRLGQAPIENLTKLLEEEDQSRRSHLRNGSSRHSRFGTTIAVQGVSPVPCPSALLSES